LAAVSYQLTQPSETALARGGLDEHVHAAASAARAVNW
jgi:hypothetical protein